MQRFHVNYGLMMVRPYFIPEARRFLNQSYRRSTFVAAFQTPNGIAYRPQNLEPMQFEADADEEMPPLPNETLQPPVSPQPEEEIDPLIEEWFNNIEIDEALLPALGMELIDSDNEDPLTSSTEHTESYPVEPQVPLDPSQLENMNPDLESLMEKYCSNSSLIPHPSPGVHFTDSLQEEHCQEQGFKWVEFDDGQFGLTNAKLTPDPEWGQTLNSVFPSPQAKHLMANTQCSARQNTPLPSDNFEIEEMIAGIIVPSAPPHGTEPGFTPNGLLIDVVSGPDPYDDYTAASILSPVPEETPSEVERGTTEEGIEDSASSINLLAYFANAELHTSTHDLVHVTVVGDEALQLSPNSEQGLHQRLPCVDLSVVSMGQDDEATQNMSQSLSHSPNPPGNNAENRASLRRLEPNMTPTQVKKRDLTTKDFKDMLFKRAKLAPLAASGNMKKNLSLTRRIGKRKHRPDTDDTEEGVAELKRARKGLTAEVQEVFKRLVDEMVAMVNCCKLGLKEESKCNNIVAQKLCNVRGFYYHFCVEAEGTKRGLVLYWKNPINITIVEYCPYWIHVLARLSSGKHLMLTGVYGPLSRNRRHILWDFLVSRVVNKLSWLVFGDFNQVGSHAEKQSKRQSIRGAHELLNTIYVCGLIDVPAHGVWYTWSNNRKEEDMVREKINRVYYNTSWMQEYPDTWVEILPIASCDHSPMVIHDHYPSAMRRDTFGNVGRQIQEVETQLASLQNRITTLKESQQQVQEEIYRKRLEFLLKCEETMWAQRAQQLWLINGDRNTKYFHTVINSRRNKS
ncbi:putative ribonuclease H protein At1g65750 family [Senna tora]|uniref:Putative ribonuclease H protein At1g65750 family n=1 Tax=Senna tora TaxID=362788 RepID=A0A834WIJ6_9FABA|nr:putative ribonuclease H protein At1g65750 family [Senna tora]